MKTKSYLIHVKYSVIRKVFIKTELKLFLLALTSVMIVLQLSCKNNPVSPTSGIDTTWTYLGLGNESIMSIGINPTNPNVIYAGTKGGLFKSIDAGKTWDSLHVSSGIYIGIIVDPKNPQTVYTASWNAVIKSTDGGTTWQMQSNGIRTSIYSLLSCITMDPFNSNVLYAGTAGMEGGYLYKTTDAGAVWDKIGGDSLAGVLSIAIDPKNGNVLYVGEEERGILWKSTDAGTSWKRTGLGRIQGLLKALFVNNNEGIYAGSSWAPSGYLPPAPFYGIFKSNDGGSTWQNIDEGLPDSAEVSSIAAQKNNADIFISVSTSYGRSGIYELGAGTYLWVWVGIADSISSSGYTGPLSVSPDDRTLYYGGAGLFKLSLK